MIHSTIEFDWDEIDKKFNYVAYDQWGYLYGYAEEPRLVHGAWPGSPSIGVLPAWVSKQGWFKSLRKRPAPPKRWSLLHGIDGLSTIWDNEMGVALYGVYGDSTAALEKVVEILNNYEEQASD